MRQLYLSAACKPANMTASPEHAAGRLLPRNRRGGMECNREADGLRPVRKDISILLFIRVPPPSSCTRCSRRGRRVERTPPPLNAFLASSSSCVAPIVQLYCRYCAYLFLVVGELRIGLTWHDKLLLCRAPRRVQADGSLKCGYVCWERLGKDTG